MVRVNDFHGVIPANAVGRVREANRIAGGLDPATGRPVGRRDPRAANRSMVRIASNVEFTQRILAQLPLDMRERALRKANREAGKVAEKAVRDVLKSGGRREAGQGTFPANSKKTGTYKKKSKEQQAARDLRKSLVQSIRQKTVPKRSTGTGALLTMVGPKRPEGSAAWILEFGGVIQLWGTGVFYRLKPRPFLGPATSATRTLQKNAYMRVMKEFWANYASYYRRYGGVLK